MIEAVLCVTCPVLRPRGHPRRPRAAQVCDQCRERIATDLAAIGPAYADLDPTPVRGVSEILSRVFESKPPLNIHDLSLLGAGTETPTGVLDFWCHDWAEELSQTPPLVVVSAMADWLLARLEWACDQHPAVDDFALDVRQLSGELRVYQRAAEKRGHPAGRCPQRRNGFPCDMPLFLDPFDAIIECGRCHTKWHRRDGGWLHLRAQQLSAEVEVVSS